MEPLAENRFTITKKLFYEGMLRVIRENYNSFIKTIILVLAAAWAVLAVVTLMSGGKAYFLVLELVVVAAIGVWLGVFMPRSKAKQAWEGMKNRSEAEMERITRFYPEYLVADNGAEEITVFYEDIEKTLQSEHLLVILNTEKMGILVARDGFVSGDMAAVQALIEGERNGAG